MSDSTRAQKLRIISELKEIIKNISSNEYNHENMEWLEEMIDEFKSIREGDDSSNSIDPLTIKYLIRGWILSIYMGDGDELYTSHPISSKNNENANSSNLKSILTLR